MYPSARVRAAVAARKTQTRGEVVLGGRRVGGQPRVGQGPGREVSRRSEEATD